MKKACAVGCGAEAETTVKILKENIPVCRSCLALLRSDRYLVPLRRILRGMQPAGNKVRTLQHATMRPHEPSRTIPSTEPKRGLLFRVALAVLKKTR